MPGRFLGSRRALLVAKKLVVAAAGWTGRASSGYYTTAAGVLQMFLPDVLRTGTAGDLIETTGATNILPNITSQDWTAGTWAKIGGAVTADATAAPDGTTTADLWTASASGAFGSYTASDTLASLTGSYTYSAYVKKGNQRYVFLDFYGSGGDRVAVFDLDTGTYVGNGGQTTSARRGIDTLAGGWFRIWESVDGLSSTNMNAAIGLASGNNVTSVSGDTVYLWGAQVEAGTLPSSYAPNKNLTTYTEDYTGGAWVVESATLTPAATTAPNGKTVATKLVANTDVHNHEIFTNTIPVAPEAAYPYTFSIYVKGAELRYVSMHLSRTSGGLDSDWVAASYDTQSSAVPQTATGTTANVTLVTTANVDAGNSWRRISLTCLTNTATFNSVGFNTVNSSTPGFGVFGSPTSYAGNDIDGVYYWGTQLEKGTAATGYWKLITAANGVRSADTTS